MLRSMESVLAYPLLLDFRNQLLGIWSASEADAIMREVSHELTGYDPASLRLKEIPVTEELTNTLDRILIRLKKKEPLQYIFGYARFREHRYQVTPDVLIPRPETEELVEHALQWLQSHSWSKSPVICDACTGSGCIAIEVSLALPDARVIASDISEAALTIARNNASRLNAKIQFVQHDLLNRSAIPEAFVIDLLISNPPYITRSEQSLMDMGVTQWEPHLALFVADEEPLIFYERLAQAGIDQLVSGGMLIVETHRDFAQQVSALFSGFAYSDIRVLRDASGNQRIVSAIKKINRPKAVQIKQG